MEPLNNIMYRVAYEHCMHDHNELDQSCFLAPCFVIEILVVFDMTNSAGETRLSVYIRYAIYNII